MTDPFDRVLRDAARRGRMAGVCPDAAMLAAYVDRGLTLAERRQVELHASGCVSCQSHLALLGAVSVEPAAAEPPRSWFPRWAWLVPVATAVLVAAVWVRLPDERLPEKIAAEQPAPVATEAPASVRPSPSAPEAAAFDSVASAPATRLAAKRTADRPVQQKPAETLGRMVANEAQAAGAAAPAAAAPSAVAPAAPPAPPAPVASPAPAIAQDALQEEVKREARQLRDARAKEADEGQRVARLESTLAKSRADVSAPALPIVVAASEGETFRAIGARIDRSIDGGRTWQHAFTSSGGPVTAAACAGGTCWFGTSDGRVERRVQGGFAGSVLPVRDRVDAIAPTAPASAVVTIQGGRKFRTTDGGATWIAEP